MRELDFQILRAAVRSAGYDPLFVTVSGAHLYGFPSPDSDIDLRGCHLLPLEEVLGLAEPSETIEAEFEFQGVKVDLVSHDVRKFFRLLLKNNGYVLEQVFSPLVVVGEEFLAELRPVAKCCITPNHYHHYRGFYERLRKTLEEQEPKLVKTLLYAYRVLLTGIHLLETGQVEANLFRLCELLDVPWVGELKWQKEHERSPAEVHWPWHADKLDSLRERLTRAYERTTLPVERDRDALNRLLLRVRLGRHYTELCP